ncbi:MAG: penicillin-binding protein 1A [Rhodovibrionaceae bacterium]
MWKWIAGFFALMALGGLVAAGVVGYLIYDYGRDLPDIDQLANYEPPTVSRVHAGDGRLLAEYSTEKRIFVPFEALPARIVNAFLSAEDKGFYNHPGVDFQSIVGAAITNLRNLGTDRRPVGASTITQQVAKNFLLTNETTLERKIREAILAMRMERVYSKDQILELYLNEIYLGFGSYGVAAAALNYFNKSLDELTLGEAAYLAALPKAPNNYHPVRRYDAAVGRRDWVIGRMEEDGRITHEEAEAARAEPLTIRERAPTEVTRADYFAEEVRREVQNLYGDDKLYGGGLSIRTTLVPELQAIADRALQEGLIAYDQRHGWRGPVAKLDLGDGSGWRDKLNGVEKPVAALDSWRLALVLEVTGEAARIGFKEEAESGSIPFDQMSWARPWLEGQQVGAAPSKPADVLAPGDVVLVAPLTEEGGGDADNAAPRLYALQQIPEISGGIVALDPNTGRVLAMTGGFSFAESEFNRVTQADRQPGSSFKPFVYLAGLDHGFTPSTIILDGPVVVDQGAGLGMWKPRNYSNEYYGPTPLRIGVEKSRNLMTVRLAQTIGPEVVSEYAEKFGIIEDMPPLLSMALGAGETTLLRLTTAYAMLVSGGKRVEPTVIDRIQDRHGATIYRHDDRACTACREVAWDRQRVPELPDDREQVADPRSAYQMVNILQGAVTHGTGRRLAELDRPIGGKTGTTNDSNDAWFMGITPNLVVGAYTGFDSPKSLGPREAGSSVALPIVKTFFEAALEGTPKVPFRIPPGINLVRVNHDTGLRARPGDSDVILEAFKPGTAPPIDQVRIDSGIGVSDGQGVSSPGTTAPSSSGSGSTGGLY